LTPSDFHLFPKLKKNLAGKRFRSNEEVIDAANTYFEDLEERHFREGIEKLRNVGPSVLSFEGIMSKNKI
jgi:hypothetical protein